MDNAINKYKQRRDARLKKRMDEEWITMKGTHVLIDDEGQVSKGPSTLKSLVEKSGGHKKKSGVMDLRKPGSANMNKGPNSPSAWKYMETLEKGGLKAGVNKGETSSKEGKVPEAEKKSYEKIPLAFSIGGSQYATPEEKKKRREIISGFMNDAKEGDVYSVGGGVGSSGGSRFKVTKSRGKLALQWENSRYKPVEMSRTNVEKFLRNGATLVKRG